MTSPHQPFKRGDFVTVTYGTQTIQAMVVLASTNGRSLMLVFDGALLNGKGMFVGSMPVLQNANGGFFDLLDPANPVNIERKDYQ